MLNLSIVQIFIEFLTLKKKMCCFEFNVFFFTAWACFPHAQEHLGDRKGSPILIKEKVTVA